VKRPLSFGPQRTQAPHQACYGILFNNHLVAGFRFH